MKHHRHWKVEDCTYILYNMWRHLDMNWKMSTIFIVVLPFAINFAVFVERLKGIDYNIILIGTWRNKKLFIFSGNYSKFSRFSIDRTYLILTYGQRTSSTIEWSWWARQLRWAFHRAPYRSRVGRQSRRLREDHFCRWYHLYPRPLAGMPRNRYRDRVNALSIFTATSYNLLQLSISSSLIIYFEMCMPN